MPTSRKQEPAEDKPPKHEPDTKRTTEPTPSEPNSAKSSKTLRALKFCAAVVLIVLLIDGLCLWVSCPQGNEVRQVRFDHIKKEVPEPIPQKIISNRVGMKFALIPAGSFIMGSQLSPEEVVSKYGGRVEWYRNEHPQHSVKITKPFYLQITEVTRGQWKKIMGDIDNASPFRNCGDECPVEMVSWYDAQEFISQLNEMEGTNKYRLPTEAEWEYACRAETTTLFFTGDCISTNQANYNGYLQGKNCPKGEYRQKIINVGSFQSNAWGLYDMHGNVWEWVQDWYGDYPSNSVVDPKGPDKGKYRVLRGGSWHDGARPMRSAFRFSYDPVRHYHVIGFRVARDF